MTFFKRNRKRTSNTNVNVDGIYVVTSMIFSSHCHKSNYGPICITMYFLAKLEDEEYYEFFSGKRLEKEKQQEDDLLLQHLDTPYVKKAEPLTKYLKNPNTVTIDIQSLFDLITDINVISKLGDFLYKNE